MNTVDIKKCPAQWPIEKGNDRIGYWHTTYKSQILSVVDLLTDTWKTIKIILKGRI